MQTMPRRYIARSNREEESIRRTPVSKDTPRANGETFAHREAKWPDDSILGARHFVGGRWRLRGRAAKSLRSAVSARRADK